MIRKILFKNIVFQNIENNKLNLFLKKNTSGLFVFPSGPGLSTINEDKIYHNSLKRADFVFFDSGFFVLLIKFFKNINVNKLSGYKFLKIFLKNLKKNEKKNIILLVDPTKKKSINNFKFLVTLGFDKNKIKSYIAPQYNPKKIIDLKLLKTIKKYKPKTIILNIGGGIQEILGYYLKKKLKFKVKIICTGAAISFFTDDQAPINDFIDKYFLGWLLRILFNPFQFFKRYFYAFKLLRIVKNNSVKKI